MSETTLKVERSGRTYGKPRSVVREIAGATNRTPGGVNQDLYGSQGCLRKSEDLAERLVALGDTKIIAAHIERLQKILAGRKAPEFSGTLLECETRADAEQNVARTELQVALSDNDPTNDREAAVRFVRRCDNEMRFVRDVRDAVAAKWNIR